MPGFNLNPSGCRRLAQAVVLNAVGKDGKAKSVTPWACTSGQLSAWLDMADVDERKVLRVCSPKPS